MSNKIRMRPSANAIAMIIQRERMPDTGAYDTLNSTPSSVDNPFVHVVDYISYQFSMSVFNPIRYSGYGYLCVLW